MSKNGNNLSPIAHVKKNYDYEDDETQRIDNNKRVGSLNKKYNSGQIINMVN